MSLCARCGTVLADIGASGVCPKCMLAEGLTPGCAPEHDASPGADPCPSPALTTGPAPRRFGDYELLEEIACGGMGVVYRARQVSLNRTVAIKMLLAGSFARPELVQRFRSEAEAVASLQHPHIVAIHEIGEHGGQPYFSMDYVPGCHLGDLVRQGPLPARRAAAYMRVIADAVHYAHMHGVLHRDLKPSNVLIDELDQPRITDFGLAKRFGGELQAIAPDSHLTLTGQMLGSPHYVSPEQAEGRARDIGPASDLYSLGAILYHLLTGRPPFQAESVAGVLREVVRAEAVPPSRLNASVPGEMETICLKCLQKDPRARYASVQELADELGRFLRDEPIRARPLTGPQRLFRWARRNPLVAGLGTAAVVLLLVIAGGSLAAGLRLRESARLANTRLYRALVTQAQAGRWSKRAGCRFNGLDAIAGAAALLPRLGLGEEAALELRNEAIACMALTDLRLVEEWPALANPIDPVSFDGGLEHYVVSDFEETASLRRSSDHSQIAAFRVKDEPFLRRQLSPDGCWLAIKHSSGRLRVWDTQAHQIRFEFDSRDSMALDFSPDSKWLAADQPGRSVLVRESAAESQLVLPAGKADPYRLSFSPSADRLAVVSLNPPGVWVWDLAARTSRLVPHAAGPRMVAWRLDGRVLAVAGSDRRLVLWDTTSWEQRAVIESPESNLDRVWFHPGGHILGTWSVDGTTRLWSVAARRELLAMPGAEILQFSQDGRFMALKSALRLSRWELGLSGESLELDHPQKPLVTPQWSAIAYSHDGLLMAAGCSRGVCLWDARTATPIGLLPIGPCESVLFSPRDGSLIACSARGVQRWDCDVSDVKGSRRITIGPPEPLAGLDSKPARKAALSRDGSTLAIEDRDGPTVRIWSVDEERLQAALNHQQLHDIALSPDGLWAAAGNWHAFNAVVWDARTGAQAAVIEASGSTTVAFSPDGRWLVTGSGAEYSVWGVGTWQLARRLDRDQVGGFPGVTAFSPDGELLALTLSRYLVSLVEPASGKLIATFEPPAPQWISSLAFSPDGTRLAAACDLQGIRVWDLRRIREQLALMRLDWQGAEWGPPSMLPEPIPLDVSVVLRPAPDTQARAADTPPQLIDLSPHYNAALTAAWHNPDASSRNDLAMLPTGRHVWAGVEFDVRGVVQLAGRTLERAVPGFPREVSGIAVGRSCRCLHFLHAAGWDAQPQSRIGAYRIHYADGETGELPLIFGQNIANWFPRPSRALLPADVPTAWTGVDPASGATKYLFLATWTNPRPESTVSHIDFISDMTDSAPFLIAVTAEP